MSFALRRSLGFLLPHFGYARCPRCRRPWYAAKRHNTWYGQGSGFCFVLCESCWQEISLSERLWYYESSWDRWMRETRKPDNLPSWTELKVAVLGGK